VWMVACCNDGALTKCKFRNKPKYRAKTIGTIIKKPVPVKAMFYFLVIPRLQKIFALMQIASQKT